MFFFAIDQLDVGGEAHGTLRLGTMGKSEGVSQFVQYLFDSTLAEQAFIRGKAVKFLVQTAKRDHGDGTIKMRLSKQKREHRNRQVHVRDPENPGGVGRSILSQHLHDLYRLVLPSLSVISGFRKR